MKLLIEDYSYPEELIQPCHIPEALADRGAISFSQVGYYFNPEENDCYFFLPKVILSGNDADPGLILNKYRPEEILNLTEAVEKEKIDREDFDFITVFSVWIYRAIAEFRKLNADSHITFEKSIASADNSPKPSDCSFLETVLSILEFANKNREFFMWTMKNIHSGYNRINWRKTISTQRAYIDEAEDTPVYLDLVNRKKQVNFEEELLVIFFSIVKYITDTYGFKCAVNLNYPLIAGQQFDNYLDGFGLTRLRQIKYKYFSDKALKMWHLCYNFFDRTSQIKSSSLKSEYLIAKDFNIVFEAMIDELLGDSSLTTGLKQQYDGKIVDHIYPYEALVNPVNDIYYIGDSKYYKTDAEVRGNSLFKQYTYAKNVIQFNLNLLLDGKGDKRQLPYRDELTEGYNITPNFFISSKISPDHQYNEPHFDNQGIPTKSEHFRNRLFDRDTLWLSHYSINFLYVLSLYAAANESAKERFKEETRQRFRKAIIELLNREYDFHRLLIAEEEMEDFVNRNFRKLSGKLFHYGDTLLLALEKGKPENKEICAWAGSLLKIESFKLQ